MADEKTIIQTKAQKMANRIIDAPGKLYKLLIRVLLESLVYIIICAVWIAGGGLVNFIKAFGLDTFHWKYVDMFMTLQANTQTAISFTLLFLFVNLIFEIVEAVKG